MVSILIITYGRREELFATLKCIAAYTGDDAELLLLDNNESDQLKNETDRIFQNSKIKFVYYNEGINFGVSVGRNYLMKRASGDIFVVLDDDIEIEDINQIIHRVKKYFKDPEIGAIAFNIKNYYTGKNLRFEIPHGNKKLDFTRNMYTYYYIGAGHALKREVLEKTGYYQADLGKYGGEERDLSFRIIEHYTILYAADLIIYHKISPKGRMPKKEENYYRYRNQVIVLGRYLPFIYRWSSYVAWSGWYLIIKRGKISDVFKVFCELVKLKKTMIGKTGMDYIKRTGGRLFY